MYSHTPPQQDKEAVDSDIARSEKELARSKREYEEALGEEEKVVARLSYCEQRVNELYDKQDRSTQVGR